MRHARRSNRRSARSTSARRSIRQSVESLEFRRHLDGTAATLPFAQDWTNIGLITTTDNWSTAPSFVGYRGDDLTLATGTDPQTLLADDTLLVVDVNANQTNPNTFTSGGVTEYELTNPVVALAGSGTADAPYLVLNLNTTGVNAIRVRYNVRDLETGADNSVQQLALHYRVGTSGTWTNVPAGYIADATDNNAAGGPVTARDVTIGGAIGNQAAVQLRWMTTNAVGNDEWIGIDDIQVEAATSSQIGFSPVSYNVNEADGTVSLTVIRNGDATAATSINWAAVSGTAGVGADYGTLASPTEPSGVLNWAANDASPKTIVIPIINDIDAETLEQFTVVLSGPTGGATIASGGGTATVSIVDNDTVAPTGLLLNEISINPADSDGPYEYVEIINTSASPVSLNNVYFTSIEADTTSNGGQVTFVKGLSGTLAAGAIAVIKSTTSGHTLPGGVLTFTDIALDGAAGALQNGSNSFALIFSPSPIALNQDLAPVDVDPLVMPSGASLLDIVGTQSFNTLTSLPSGYAPFYGASVGIFVDALTRIVGSNTANNAASWYGGDLIDPDVINATPLNSDFKGYNPLGEFGTAGTFPAGAQITPGAANYAASASVGQFVLLNAVPTSVSEGGSSVVTVVRTGGATGAESVTVSLAGTASGADYTLGGSATLAFAHGQTSATLTINITDDPTTEAAETIVATLSSPTGGATVTGAGAVITIAGSDPAQTSVLINEAKINPNGTDDSNEWIELIGTPNAPLVGYWLLGLEGDAATGDLAVQGKVNFFQSLSNFTLGANGLLVLKGAAGTAPSVSNPQTAVASLPFFDTVGGVLQNGSQSLILVFSENLSDSYASTGVNQYDFDADNDGTLDPGSVAGRITPTAGGTATIPAPTNVLLVDGFGYSDGGAGDIAYTAVLTQTGYTPTGVSRLLGNTTALSASSWFGGTFGTGTDPTVNAYSATNSFAVPSGAGTPGVTIGEQNYPGVGDTTPPTVVGTPVRNYVTGLNVQITFSENVGASLASGDFTLTNNTTSTVIPSANINVAYNSGTNVATLTYTGAAAGLLPNGNYTLAFGGTPNAIEDAAGNDLAANTFNFRWLNGDTTQNGATNFDDLLVLAANYNTAPGVNYNLGDFDYSGNINFDDLLILAANYNATLPGSLGGDNLLVAPPAPTFGSSADDDDNADAFFGDSVID